MINIEIEFQKFGSFSVLLGYKVLHPYEPIQKLGNLVHSQKEKRKTTDNLAQNQTFLWPQLNALIDI
jgi:hypothetical protein